MREEICKWIEFFERKLKSYMLKSRIERHEKSYITLKNDKDKLMYCSACWDKEQLIIQVDKRNNGRFACPNCKQNSCYDEELAKATSVIKHNKDVSDFVKYNGVNFRRH